MTPDEARVIQEIKSRAESNSHQIEEIKERIAKQESRSEVLYQMSESIALMAQSLKQVEGDVGEVKENQKELSVKVSTLENAPARETLDNMKKIKIAAITAVATMLATGVAGALIMAIASK